MLVIASFFILLLLGVPIAFIVLISATVGVALYTGTSLLVVPQQLFAGLDSFPLLAIPFFIVAGLLASKGKTAEHLVKCMNVLFGRISGGSVIATIATCAFFAAISGSSMATVVAVGTIMVPGLLKQGYPEEMNVGVVASGGTLGVLIPPSAPMVLLCVAINSSVGKQFLAGILPGLLLAAAWCIYVYIVCKKNNYRSNVTYTFKEAVQIVVKAIPALLYPIIVLGSIYTGWATPTEAAAISVVYVMFLETIVYKTLKLKDYPRAFYDALISSAILVIIIGCANTLNWLVTSLQIPAKVTAFIGAIVSTDTAFLLLLLLVLVIVGCFMDLVSVIVILAPIILPSLQLYGIDPIHFGIVAIMAAQIGYLSPPFGTNLFVTMDVSGKSLQYVAKAVLPYLVILIIVTLVITFIPQISLFIPNLMN